jgi:hypothetical protein
LGVRSIPLNRRSLTGRIPSVKNGGMVDVESALERDFATVLEFDDRVCRYEAQPVFVHYDRGGRRQRGVPDFLVWYSDGFGKKPLLCDVKYRAELFERWTTLKPRLKAALAFARDQGWGYRIMTEVEIRTPFLVNARFLLPYRSRSIEQEHEDAILAVLSASRITPELLMRRCRDEGRDEAASLATLWALTARGEIKADLAQRLTMQSQIWVEGAA